MFTERSHDRTGWTLCPVNDVMAPRILAGDCLRIADRSQERSIYPPYNDTPAALTLLLSIIFNGWQLKSKYVIVFKKDVVLPKQSRIEYLRNFFAKCVGGRVSKTWKRGNFGIGYR